MLYSACNVDNDVLDTVKELLEHNANPNNKTRNRRTPLHIAAGVGNLEIVRLLLQHKQVKRNTRDMFGT